MLFRSTIQDRANYFAHPAKSHSDLKEFFKFLDPSMREEEKPTYDNEKRKNRIGSAVHSKLLTPMDYDLEFYELSGSMPGDKAVPILNYAFEQACKHLDLERVQSMSLGFDLNNPEDWTDYILQGCTPGVASEDGYGGSWKDETKISKLLDEKGIAYWKELASSQGKITLSLQDRITVEDMVSRVQNSRWADLFKESSYDVPGITAYFEWVNLDVTVNGIKAKGMMDIVIVNTSNSDFFICGLCIRPNHYIVIDIKTISKGPGSAHATIRQFRYDRQCVWYSGIVKTQYPYMLPEDPAILFISYVKNSDPLMWKLSTEDALVAVKGLNPDGTMASEKEAEHAVLNRTPGFIHGFYSMIFKYRHYQSIGLENEYREVDVVDKGYATTNLWQYAKN